MTVDPDDPTTWPSALRDRIAEVAAIHLGPDAEYLEHVPLTNESVVGLFDGRPLRAYHATRLLPHEAESVRADGLRALTPDHVELRIAGAEAAGAITGRQADGLRRQTVYSTGFKGERSNQVCAVAGITGFVEAFGVWPLLNTWGGEAIYMHADRETQAELGRIGTPSIVVLDLDLAASDWLMFPELGSMLAHHLLEIPARGADVFYRASVPSSAVVAIWQPGSPEYDRHSRLPR